MAAAKARWEQLKDEGNALFNEGSYNAALEAYTSAIRLRPDAAVLFSNRSAANLKLERFDQALADASKCMELQPNYDKGHFRAGSALEAMGNLAAALPMYEAALGCNSSSSELAAKIKTLKTALRQQEKVGKRKAQKTASKPRAAAQGAAGFGGAGGSGSSSGSGGGGQGIGRTSAAEALRAAGPNANTEPAPSGWAAGLAPAKQHEWLVDCYRMRVDDDYAWGGGNLHGLYDPDHTRASICEDLLCFAKLAVAAGVVPPGWKWDQFLSTAAQLLPYAFEKSDAQDKWGGENVFAVAYGGRSLRYTGEVVYGTSIMEQAETPALEKIRDKVQGRWKQLMAAASEAADGSGEGCGSGSSSEVFGDVGGVVAWRDKLYKRLRLAVYR